MNEILGETLAEGYFAPFVSEEDMQGKNSFTKPAAPVIYLNGEESWAANRRGRAAGMLIDMTQI